MDIQKMLDAWLAGNPSAQKYVSKLYYVKEGQPLPKDATHSLRLGSATSVERHLLIGAVVKPPYSVLIDVMLAAIATQP